MLFPFSLSLVEGLLFTSSGRWEFWKAVTYNTASAMSFWVYILRCADKSYYTGHTDNLEKRVAEHETGEIEGYASTRLPVKLVFTEQFPTREEALACEQQIKGWSRKKKEALMRGDWKEVSRLARRSHPSKTSG